MWQSKRERNQDLDGDRKGPHAVGSVAQKPWLETRPTKSVRCLLSVVSRGSEDLSQRVPQIEQLVA